MTLSNAILVAVTLAYAAIAGANIGLIVAL